MRIRTATGIVATGNNFVGPEMIIKHFLQTVARNQKIWKKSWQCFRLQKIAPKTKFPLFLYIVEFSKQVQWGKITKTTKKGYYCTSYRSPLTIWWHNTAVMVCRLCVAHSSEIRRRTRLPKKNQKKTNKTKKKLQSPWCFSKFHDLHDN